MNPADMTDLGVGAGDLVEITNDNGSTQAMVWPIPTVRRKETFMLFAYPTGATGNVVSKAVNELIIPNYKQTWGDIRKIADAPEVTRHLSFKSPEYNSRPDMGMSAQKDLAGWQQRAHPSRISSSGTAASQAGMVDPFGRSITYLRVSVTDRCDLRCVYCMAEDMTFLPRDEVLSLEELERLCAAFVGLGVRKLRLTGGEPLVRRDVLSLFEWLGTWLGHGLDELTLTTNGTQLAKHAAALATCGVRRVNVSPRYARSAALRRGHARGPA